MNEILGISPDHKFMSLIPVGVPAYTAREKEMKGLSDVLTILDITKA